VLAVGVALGVRRIHRQPPEPPIEVISARLRRLDAERARLLVAQPQPPALCCRLIATSHAYDGVLRDACTALGIEDPGPPMLDSVVRVQTEAALSAAGLRW
jgi:hypothetical protein